MDHEDGADAALIWQQTFSRGQASQIKRSVAYANDTVLALGDALPVDAGTTGSWLMLLDGSSGEMRWQRFYNGAYHYSAIDLGCIRTG